MTPEVLESIVEMLGSFDSAGVWTIDTDEWPDPDLEQVVHQFLRLDRPSQRRVALVIDLIADPPQVAQEDSRRLAYAYGALFGSMPMTFLHR